MNKECPFCGGTVLDIRTQSKGTGHVHCMKCGAYGPPAFTEADAEEAWDTRQGLPQPMLAAALEIMPE